MIFGLSGLKRAELGRILQDMKALCGQEEEEALKHLDALLKRAGDLMDEAHETDERRRQSSWEEDDAKRTIEHFESELRRAECLLTQGSRNKTHYPTWASDIVRDATNLGNQWGIETRKEFQQAIADLRVRAFSFAKEYRLHTVKESQKRLDDIERSLEGGVVDDFWELPKLEEFIRHLDFEWDAELRKQHPEDYQRLKSRAVEVEERATDAYHARAISEALEGVISTAGVKFQREGVLILAILSGVRDWQDSVREEMEMFIGKLIERSFGKDCFRPGCFCRPFDVFLPFVPGEMDNISPLKEGGANPAYRGQLFAFEFLNLPFTNPFQNDEPIGVTLRAVLRQPQAGYHNLREIIYALAKQNHALFNSAKKERVGNKGDCFLLSQTLCAADDFRRLELPAVKENVERRFQRFVKHQYPAILKILRQPSVAKYKPGRTCEAAPS